MVCKTCFEKEEEIRKDPPSKLMREKSSVVARNQRGYQRSRSPGTGRSNSRPDGYSSTVVEFDGYSSTLVEF